MIRIVYLNENRERCELEVPSYRSVRILLAGMKALGYEVLGYTESYTRSNIERELENAEVSPLY